MHAPSDAHAQYHADHVETALAAPAPALKPDLKIGSTDGVFGEGFDNLLGLMFLSNAALTLKPPVLPTVPMLPGLPGMGSRNTLNPLGPLQPVTIEARATTAAETLIEPSGLLPQTAQLPGGAPGGPLALARILIPGGR